MANTSAVWGIEIGQSALKALRCHLEGDKVVADAFDYIEYPKILSQPESEPEEMVREALETFVSRNDLKKTRVALSVAGSNGLAKFFKPPPVELKKLTDVVKYEARQQIPFELDDVIWDYQLMAGGDISDGFALEAEVGLFAMKRDAVFRTLKPLEAADIEVDLLQLAPLSIYNMVTYDRSLMSEDEDFEYDSENPPKSTVVLAMGTDSTDLIVTNGYRVWQRSMPLGGNHFTRQLTKDLKLTFAKAEHLKRNAMEADDPKLVFQAMRPVFNDLVTEVQRSMGFFRSLNKQAELGSIMMMGNSVKLPGLSQYLNKNLAMDVEVVENFSLLDGEEVTSAPAFKDHISSFVPVYGLCLQALGKGPSETNLVPKEVVTERLIRSKKPWAVAASAALLLGFAGNLLFAGNRYAEVHEDRWGTAVSSAKSTKTASDAAIAEDAAQLAKLKLLKSIGRDVSGSGDRRLVWMEIIRTLFESLNRPDPNEFDVQNPPSPEDMPYKEWPILFVTKMDCKRYADVATYLDEKVLKKYNEDHLTRIQRMGLLVIADDSEDAEADAEVSDEEGEEGFVDFTAETLLPAAPEGVEAEDHSKGWVIQIDGYHFHNGQEYAATGDEREEYVLKTLVHELETGSVELPIGDGKTETFTYKELGLYAPFILKETYDENHKVANPEYAKKYGKTGGGGAGGPGMGGGGYGGGPGMGGGGPGMGGGAMGGGYGGEGMYGGGGGYGGGGYGGGPGGPGGAAGADGDEEDIPQSFDAPKSTFVLQIIWKETPLTQRLEAKRKAAEEAAAAAEEEAAAAGDDELAGL